MNAGSVTLDGMTLTGCDAPAVDVGSSEIDDGAIRSVRTALTISGSRIAGKLTGGRRLLR